MRPGFIAFVAYTNRLEMSRKKAPWPPDPYSRLLGWGGRFLLLERKMKAGKKVAKPLLHVGVLSHGGPNQNLVCDPAAIIQTIPETSLHKTGPPLRPDKPERERRTFRENLQAHTEFDGFSFVDVTAETFLGLDKGLLIHGPFTRLQVDGGAGLVQSLHEMGARNHHPMIIERQGNGLILGKAQLCIGATYP